jgi:predicted ATP-grasp superfamily ATP-dependent carboligase
MTNDHLLIVGFSARAAAWSAARAGYSPLAVDRFGDADLVSLCPARTDPSYPAGLIALAKSFPDCPWIFTGGLENRPEIVDGLAAQRRLWGNQGRVLRRVRDPFALTAALRKATLPTLDALPAEGVVPSGAWLCKPRRSCGGSRITFVGAHRPLHADEFYLQRFVRGVPCSAVYVAAGGRAIWLGATRQLSGTAWTAASGFCYSGSLGPLRLSRRHRETFRQLGDCLAAEFDLRGLFGVDAILSNGRIWALEVNPRYTASVEVLERASSTAFLTVHAAACRHGCLPPEPPRTASACYGKAIVYAERDFTTTESFFADLGASLPEPGERPADIPAVGQAIKRGQPLLTVFAAGGTSAAVLAKLKRSAAFVRRLVSKHARTPDYTARSQESLTKPAS